MLRAHDVQCGEPGERRERANIWGSSGRATRPLIEHVAYSPTFPPVIPPSLQSLLPLFLLDQNFSISYSLFSVFRLFFYR